MLGFPRWKVWLISLICVVGAYYSIPSFLPERIAQQMPGWLAPQVNLGLDLAGGSHLLLEAETSGVARQRIENMEDILRRELRREGVQYGEVSTQNGRLSFVVRNPAQVQRAVEISRQQAQPTAFGGSSEWTVRAEGNRVSLTPTEAGISAAIDQAMDTARDVIDRRINALGTLEPTIIRQGSDRIVVQVPGLEDPEALKQLIGRTARLEFKLVDLSVTPEQLQSGRAPVGSQILPYQEGGQGNGRIAVQRRAIITGDQIANATQAFDQTSGAPVVTIQFDGTGARRFARVTQENVGRPFAIILDNVVISAPNINEPILGGSAQISGSFTVETANALAISLRSGRLPVELTVVEERTVGPDLGKDSIERGAIAMAIGSGLVLIFMLLTYGRFGVYADIAILLNVALILGAMSIMNATLTLPGIAGFVLTVGAAVDANVIINERIREEQRRGRNVLQAIEHGYSEAQSAIFDANITNVIAGALLFYFGSGPVRGFAIVMMIGIVTSVFTAVTVTRMFVSFWLRKRPRELVI
ncbi:protein translocase subunit SecD [Sphingosinicella terrae]|uniref:protein translocase subunit SecD n=1 Tax=Sphingosinicella terrae TaxID=2172047 RepID=UPI000E0D889D|nr:protein translocase subunit SecD [Sphingosinicella terrae]